MDVDAHPALQFRVDWEDAPGVGSPELAATWARLSITSGRDTITLVGDARSASTRTAIYAPAYSLAEWMSFNWWLIDSDYRPGFLRPTLWHASTAPATRSPWMDHHAMRRAADGVAWPDLVLLPSADQMIVSWAAGRRGELDYLSSGQIELPKEEVQRTLADFIETVVERLKQVGIAGTPLHEEWAAIRSTSEEEAAFCRSAARLGLDPLSLNEPTSDLILRGAGVLEAELLDDFLVSADPAQLEADLKWTEHAVEMLHSVKAESAPLPDLAVEALDMRRPWLAGYSDARRLRTALGAGSTEAVNTARLVAVHQDVGTASHGLISLGTRSASRSVTVIASRPRRSFDDARAIWRALRSDRNFLVSGASMPLQKAERAFAAEFLAPSDGLREMLPDLGDVVIDLGTVSELAEHYKVSELVIEHQLANHFRIDAESRNW